MTNAEKVRATERMIQEEAQEWGRLGGVMADVSETLNSADATKYA